MERGGRQFSPAAAHETARVMMQKDKTRLLRRNTMRGRLIVTQRHHAEITRNSVDSPDCEHSRSREQIETPRGNPLGANRHATSNRTVCDGRPHCRLYLVTLIR